MVKVTYDAIFVWNESAHGCVQFMIGWTNYSPQRAPLFLDMNDSLKPSELTLADSRLAHYVMTAPPRMGPLY